MSLYGNSESETVLLSNDDTGGRLHLRNKSGQDGLVANVLEHGARWSLIDHAGRPALTGETTGFGSRVHLDRGDGSAWVTLDSSPGRDAFRFESGDTGSLAAIREDMEQGSMFNLLSTSGQVTMVSGTMNTAPSIDLYNNAGELSAQATVRSKGSGGGSFQISNAQGERVAILRSDLEGNGRLDLLDTAGHLLASLQTRQGSGATLALLSEFGKTVCALAGTNDGGILNLMNRTGVPVVSAGSAENSVCPYPSEGARRAGHRLEEEGSRVSAPEQPTAFLDVPAPSEGVAVRGHGGVQGEGVLLPEQGAG